MSGNDHAGSAADPAAAAIQPQDGPSRRSILWGAAGIASPSPDPLTMLLLAVPCVVLIEIAEILIWANDRRRANRPSMYAGLADDEPSPLDFDAEPRDEASLR